MTNCLVAIAIEDGEPEVVCAHVTTALKNGIEPAIVRRDLLRVIAGIDTVGEPRDGGPTISNTIGCARIVSDWPSEWNTYIVTCGSRRDRLK